MNLKKEFSKIYDKQVERIYRFIFLKVSSKEAAEDLTSETFLRTWKAFEAINQANAQLTPILNQNAFVFQIARNVIADYYRLRQKDETAPITDHAIDDNSPNL